jgi:rubrerythrin
MGKRVQEALISVDPTSVTKLVISDPRHARRVLRQALMAELDAANLYQQVADSLQENFPKLAKLFNDVANEELVHEGEFWEAINSLGEEDEGFHIEGTKEAAKQL